MIGNSLIFNQLEFGTAVQILVNAFREKNQLKWVLETTRGAGATNLIKILPVTDHSGDFTSH